MLAFRNSLLTLLTVALLTACSPEDLPPASTAGYSVAEVPLHQISDDLAAGRTTSAIVTGGYIARITAMDGELNSVIAIAPDALQQAAASDARRAAGEERGPLDGVPILLKDNLDAIGMPTTAGSYALAENMPERDSEVTLRLRAAGMVILGKVNLSQFAGFRNTASFNGSTVGGSPKNPYDIRRSPAGSSSGSGVATAMSFAAATIGTETAGSIVGPSSVNGIVGMKPTIALVSRRGIVPISLNQDSSGPMTRTVRDAAMILDAIAGTDPEDPWSAEADEHVEPYEAALDPDALQGVRLGVIRPTGPSASSVTPLFGAALDVLEAQGADLIELPSNALVDPRPEMRVILLHDFKVDLNAYLETTPGPVPVRTLSDLIEFSLTDPRESMHTMDYWDDAQATENGRSGADYRAALANGHRLTRDEGIDRLLQEYDLDGLVTPTGTPASRIEPDGTPRAGPIPEGPRGTRPPGLTVVAAVAGYPLISVPMGLVDGLPVGLTFAGTAWTEARLLAFAYAYEQASMARIPPERALGAR
jgi:amidase